MNITIWLYSHCLSLNNDNIIITINILNEKNDIRKLLAVDKNYLSIFNKKNNSNGIIKKDNSNFNETIEWNFIYIKLIIINHHLG